MQPSAPSVTISADGDSMTQIEFQGNTLTDSVDQTEAGFELDADGLLAVCIQHEMDHLEGRLFVDYLSELKRQRLRKKLAKARRRSAASQGAEPARVL